jgi:hypothetical protein
VTQAEGPPGAFRFSNAKQNPFDNHRNLSDRFCLGAHDRLPSDRPGAPQLMAGIEALWHPEVFFSSPIVFIMFGKSLFTGAQIFFHLRDDRI